MVFGENIKRTMVNCLQDRFGEATPSVAEKFFQTLYKQFGSDAVEFLADIFDETHKKIVADESSRTLPFTPAMKNASPDRQVLRHILHIAATTIDEGEESPCAEFIDLPICALINFPDDQGMILEALTCLQYWVATTQLEMLWDFIDRHESANDLSPMCMGAAHQVYNILFEQKELMYTGKDLGPDVFETVIATFRDSDNHFDKTENADGLRSDLWDSYDDWADTYGYPSINRTISEVADKLIAERDEESLIALMNTIEYAEDDELRGLEDIPDKIFNAFPATSKVVHVAVICVDSMYDNEDCDEPWVAAKYLGSIMDLRSKLLSMFGSKILEGGSDLMNTIAEVIDELQSDLEDGDDD